MFPMYGRVLINRLVDLKVSSDLTWIILWFTSVPCKGDQLNLQFLRTQKSSTYTFEKAILYPRNQSLKIGSKHCTWPGHVSGKQRVSQHFCICSSPSFIAK